ncbi:hypothetical protein [Pontibaca methylaminivorans]|uniref:Uncharacterized protein n=1 Tax=Pontibaca methylaminivorans TaxID=515897 RepID=A0A1R3X836_9RHOB|nr:hypothetical protein [Pontibaca methylaminivorans]SIT87077.1 hypothetical protein SAMN05421849_2552 [Pontibaca methylaminivorans]
MSDSETLLRELWTQKGVSLKRQNELLAEIRAKAQPGSTVGPFVIPGKIETRRQGSGPKIRNYWETHLYTYAYACRPASKWSAGNRAALRAKCLRHGHTMGECQMVERNPEHFIRTGRLAP